jgi:glycerol-3-phosphate acyltransferase PlsY
MYFIFLLLSLTLAYLAGSINFAILISRQVKGIDIRSLGNENPGTANVGREVGRGWAALVFAGDLIKGLAPLILAKTFFFPGDNYADYFALLLTGMAAITGHCWPLYFGFRGGGGLATSIGIYMFFIPVEFFISLVLAFLAVLLFFRKQKYPLGQLTPMIFVPLAPVLVILSNLLPEMHLIGTLKPGGHPWYVITGIIALSAYIFIINIRLVLARFAKDQPT